MSLFPAYAPDDTEKAPISVQRLDLEDLPFYSEHDLTNEPDDIHCPNVEDEAELLESSVESSNSSDEAALSRKRKLDDSPEETPAKKKKKRKHKKNDKKRKEELYSIEDTDEFYIDKKPDPGNLHVSTLYYPARPEYHQSRIGVCITIGDFKKSKKRWKRYYEVDIRFIKEKNYNTGQNDEQKEKNLGDFENIADSKKRWDDSRTETELTAKTAEYNKYLNEHPNDVDKWLEFVHFQENRYSFDVLNYRAVSESSARDVCRQKQLSILDVALSHNPKSVELLDAKLQLTRLLKASPEYLSMLKNLIASETDFSIIARLWCALTEGVSGSAALCSAVSVREAHTAAVNAMKRDQRAYVEMFYRYGLFLRHSGLLEQLHLLIDLVTAMNFTPKTEAFKCESKENVAERERKLADEEYSLTMSGLPLSAIWTRVESIRSAAHWKVEPTSGAQDADPQRCPDATDVADMIAPVTRPEQLFILAVHVLRLLRVPLFPMDACTDALLMTLHPLIGSPPVWEGESSEALLPILLETQRASDYKKIVATHAALPNYFQHGDFLDLVEKIFCSCLEWTSGQQRLAILIWWIRFQAALLALNTENRTEALRVRKSLQRVLKRYATSPLAFAQFASVELASCGRERASHVAVAAFRSADSESRANRLAIARLVCEISTEQSVGSWTLVCAALGRSLPLDLSNPPSIQLLEEAFNECEHRSRTLWTEAEDDYQDLQPTECLLPSDDSEWWICRYEIQARLHPGRDWSYQSGELTRLASETNTPRRKRMHEAASSCLVSHCGKSRSIVARALLRTHTQSVRLAAVAGVRPVMPTLPPPPPPSTVAALAVVLPLLLECEETENRTPSVGSGRRALAALRSVTAPGAPASRSPLMWRLRLEAEAKLDGGNAKTALYLALDACPSAKDLYVEGVRAAPGEFAELTDLLLEKQLRLHTLPEELAPI